jgi:uncharacterized protein (TIGR02145 family)
MKHLKSNKFFLPFLIVLLSVLFNSCRDDDDLKVYPVLYSDAGVLINGVKWAKTNVAAPSTFAANPEDYGMFYQWNSNVGWPVLGKIATDGSSKWNNAWTGGYSNPSSSDRWLSANDPSPEGWRIPTFAEIKTLIDTARVLNTFHIQNGIYGRKFIDKTNGNSIFMPAPGYRDNVTGVLSNAGYGFFWSSEAQGNAGTAAYYLTTYDARASYNYFSYALGLSVRPVKRN